MLRTPRLVPAALAALTFAIAPALAFADAPKVQDITITGDLGAYHGAPDLSTSLPEQLQKAIAEKVADKISAKGLEIRVRIDRATLPRVADASAPGAKAELVGTVFVMKQVPGAGKTDAKSEQAAQKVYQLTVASAPHQGQLPDGSDYVLIPPDRGDYQQSLVNSFADYVAQHI